MLANVPRLQQPHTLLLLAPVVGCCAAAMLTNTQAAKSRTRLLLHNMLRRPMLHAPHSLPRLRVRLWTL
jgi:hypothetical protein